MGWKVGLAACCVPCAPLCRPDQAHQTVRAPCLAGAALPSSSLYGSFGEKGSCLTSNLLLPSEPSSSSRLKEICCFFTSKEGPPRKNILQPSMVACLLSKAWARRKREGGLWNRVSLALKPSHVSKQRGDGESQAAVPSWSCLPSRRWRQGDTTSHEALSPEPGTVPSSRERLSP